MFKNLRKFKSTLMSKAAAFHKDQEGNFAVMLGLTAIPLFMSIGAAVDYTRVTHAHSAMTTSLDAAVLAVSRDLSTGRVAEADVQQAVTNLFNANIAGLGLSGTQFRLYNIAANKATGIVSAQGEATVPMTIMKIANFNEKKVGTMVEATYAQTKFEISMMLDITGSMQGSKIAALKVAAADAVKILMPEDGTSKDKVRIGLVPYANAVNPGVQVASLVTNGASSTCVTERLDPTTNYTDDDPLTYPVGADLRITTVNWKCPQSEVLPLTDKRADLLSQINSYNAGGTTAGHLGVAWSYYMLSPNWDNVWDTKAKPRAYNAPNNKKIAILMTDGSFNTFFASAPNDFSIPEIQDAHKPMSAKLAKDTCADMRSRGIEIYSIAFQAPADAQLTLKDCAPDKPQEQHYFNAGNPQELRDAFKKIALSIQNLRLTR